MTSAASSASSTSSAPQLYFPDPDEMVVRVELFGIMLCDQLEASASVGVRAKDSRKRKRAKVPPEAQCFHSKVASEDPILRLALYADSETDSKIVRYAKEVCAFAHRQSPDMPPYQRDAYDELLTTNDHILQLAAVYFFVSWHVDCDPDTNECTLVRSEDGAAARLLDELGFDGNMKAMYDVHNACSHFERGTGEASTMMSFVHTLVCNRWKEVAPVPNHPLRPSQRARVDDQRRFANSSSASCASKSESSSVSSSESDVSLACHSTSLSSESLPSESSPTMASTTSSQVLPSAKALSTN